MFYIIRVNVRRDDIGTVCCLVIANTKYQELILMQWSVVNAWPSPFFDSASNRCVLSLRLVCTGFVGLRLEQGHCTGSAEVQQRIINI